MGPGPGPESAGNVKTETVHGRANHLVNLKDHSDRLIRTGWMMPSGDHMEPVCFASRIQVDRDVDGVTLLV